MGVQLQCIGDYQVPCACASGGAGLCVPRLQAETEATSKVQQEASAERHSLWQRLKSQLVG